MSTPRLSYQARLREAQTLFRQGGKTEAFTRMRALVEEYPETEPVETFYGATARYIESELRKSVQTSEYETMIIYGRMLLHDARFRDRAERAVLEAARATLPAAERLALLHEVCAYRFEMAEYWREIGRCLTELPAAPAKIELCFRARMALPEDAVLLETLAGLIARAVPSPLPAPALDAAAQLTALQGSNTEAAARSAAYAKLRQRARAATAQASQAEALATRLAVEEVIQAAQTRTQAGSPPPAPAPDVDVWSYLTAGTVADPARDEMRFSGPAQTLLAGHGLRRKRRTGGLSQRVRMILSLWLHGLNREASLDRIGYVWLVMDPLMQIVIICAVPFFLHSEAIYDMPTLPFGIIGACFWLVFRISAVGAISGGGVLKPQLEHPVIRRFDIIVARSFNALINFMVAGGVLLGITALYGMTEWPENLLMFLLFLGVSWIFGLCYGIVLHSLIERYPGLRRINTYSMRFVGLMSALFYVPEQLPDAVVRVILYNPLLHIVQFARSYWFHGYEADYVSAGYVLGWVLVMAVLALSCMVIDDRRPAQVRA